MLCKAGARWHEFLHSLNMGQLKKLKDIGLLASQTRIRDGIIQGNENIINALGYTSANVDKLTQQQYIKAYDTILSNIEKNQILGNVANVQRNEDALRFLDEIHHAGQYPTKYHGKELENVHTYVNAKLLGTENLNLSGIHGDKQLYNALVKRHEVHEAVEAERLLRKFYENQDNFMRRLLQNTSPLVRNDLKTYADPKSNNYNPFHLALLANKTNAIGTLENYNNNYKSLLGHTDIRVLLKERKLLDRIPQQYDLALNNLRKLRNETGETTLLNELGQYNPNTTLENFGKTNYRNVLNSGMKNITTPNFEYRRYY